MNRYARLWGLFVLVALSLIVRQSVATAAPAAFLATSTAYTCSILGASAVTTVYTETAVATPRYWSDPTTWASGQPPIAGADVAIAPGETIILDISPPPLGGLAIEGKLIFAEKDVELTAEWIMVHGANAMLQIGTEATPFTHRATITLTGTDETASVSAESGGPMGTKFLGAHGGGTIEVHGARRAAVSWTQLDGTANPGATTITLAKAVNWRVGDQIVIAPTGFDPLQAEQVTIMAVSGRNVSFAPPLVFQHWGTVQTVAGTAVDQRAEVGLLTRDVVVQGAADSFASSFGGHTMIMEGGHARIEGAEFRFMGQMGHRARYPMHWHFAGDRPTDYFRNNSVHHSFHRAVVVHGTHNTLVADNVAFDIFSHTYVPAEDGMEEGNRFLDNLGILTRRLAYTDFAFACLNCGGREQQEWRPGVFWLTNPNNMLHGNHAAGALEGIGFFYDVAAVGKVEPAAVDFQNNVAHTIQATTGGNDRYPRSTRGYGLFMHGEFGPARQEFARFTAYKNSISAAWLERDNHFLVDSVLADNGTGVVLFEAGLEDTLIVGQTANTNGALPLIGTSAKAGAIHLPEKFFEMEVAPQVRNVTIVNQRDAAVVNLQGSILHPNLLQNITLINTQPVWLKHSNMIGGLTDEDGSLTGVRGVILGQSSPLVDGGCTVRAAWQAAVCPASMHVHLQLTSKSTPFGSISAATNESGSTAVPLYTQSPTVKRNYLFAATEYELVFGSTPAPNQLELTTDGEPGSWLYLTFAYGYTDFGLGANGVVLPAAASISDVGGSQESTYYYDTANGILHLKLFNNAAPTTFVLGDVSNLEPPATPGNNPDPGTDPGTDPNPGGGAEPVDPGAGGGTPPPEEPIDPVEPAEPAEPVTAETYTLFIPVVVQP